MKLEHFLLALLAIGIISKGSTLWMTWHFENKRLRLDADLQKQTIALQKEMIESIQSASLAAIESMTNH